MTENQKAVLLCGFHYHAELSTCSVLLMPTVLYIYIG